VEAAADQDCGSTFIMPWNAMQDEAFGRVFSQSYSDLLSFLGTK